MHCYITELKSKNQYITAIIIWTLHIAMMPSWAGSDNFYCGFYAAIFFKPRFIKTTPSLLSAHILWQCDAPICDLWLLSIVCYAWYTTGLHQGMNRLFLRPRAMKTSSEELPWDTRLLAFSRSQQSLHAKVTTTLCLRKTLTQVLHKLSFVPQRNVKSTMAGTGLCREATKSTQINRRNQLWYSIPYMIITPVIAHVITYWPWPFTYCYIIAFFVINMLRWTDRNCSVIWPIRIGVWPESQFIEFLYIHIAQYLTVSCVVQIIGLLGRQSHRMSSTYNTTVTPTIKIQLRQFQWLAARGVLVCVLNVCPGYGFSAAGFF